MDEQNIKKFDEPITIKCVVNNENLVANITSELNLPKESGFFLIFSDGTSFEALVNQSGKWHVNNLKHQPYIKAVEKHLNCFTAVRNCDWYKFEVGNEANPLLVWVCAEKYNSEKCLVYFNGDYQFHLLKTKKDWEIKSMRVNAAPVNQDIAAQIAAKLNKKLYLRDR
jgi:hypothetical protein